MNFDINKALWLNKTYLFVYISIAHKIMFFMIFGFITKSLFSVFLKYAII